MALLPQFFFPRLRWVRPNKDGARAGRRERESQKKGKKRERERERERERKKEKKKKKEVAYWRKYLGKVGTLSRAHYVH